MEPARRSELVARTQPFADALAAGSTLDELALTLSQALQPELDLIGELALLDELAAGCPTPTRDGVMQYLFGSGMFDGDRSDYHGWRNSCIDHVVARRRGMPISLAVVGIEVARRVGVELAGVGMPGHFLIGDPLDPAWFADPFHGRTALGRDDCRQIVAAMGMSRWSDRFLQTIPSRLVVGRMLNNLKMSCERRDDPIRLAIVMQMRAMVPELGDDTDEVRLAASVLN